MTANSTSKVLYGFMAGMELWANLALNLIALNAHKRLFFQRGFQALSLIPYETSCFVTW
ncbi:transposase, IS4 family protein [Sphaerospermopsis reniformis]|uniref:Transposase, IS4 family protein n=1 Tax=Sphaerospermopsis reniformis TaxID=531300 RepID=A0A479ZWD2_9CYAN|nr:transposase, IS4 family protein [Sphaerospermopsis reniformis]